jgi:hypothetical protein
MKPAPFQLARSGWTLPAALTALIINRRKQGNAEAAAALRKVGATH